MNDLLRYLNLGEYPPETLPTVLSAAFVAGLARGFSGFGASLIFTPLASMSIGPKLAAPLLYIVDLVASAGLIPRALRNANRREVAVMALGAMVGAPFGAYLLDRADPITIRWIIAAVAAPTLFLLLSGWRMTASREAKFRWASDRYRAFFTGSLRLGDRRSYYTGWEDRTIVI